MASGHSSVRRPAYEGITKHSEIGTELPMGKRETRKRMEHCFGDRRLTCSGARRDANEMMALVRSARG